MHDFTKVDNAIYQRVAVRSKKVPVGKNPHIYVESMPGEGSESEEERRSLKT